MQVQKNIPVKNTCNNIDQVVFIDSLKVKKRVPYTILAVLVHVGTNHYSDAILNLHLQKHFQNESSIAICLQHFYTM